MKKFFINITLLLLLFFLLDKPIGYFISENVKAKQFDKRIEKIEENYLNAQVIVLGSSRALNDIDAGKLEDLSGLSSYNLGFSGSNLSFHLSILHLILASDHIPQKIVLTLDHGLTFMKADQGIYRQDKLDPFSSYSNVYREICDNSNKLYWLGRLFWMYRENENLFPALAYLKNGTDLPDITSDIDAFGSIILRGRSPEFNVIGHHDAIQVYDKSQELPFLLSSFEQIIHLCEINKIELFLVLPPALKLRFDGFHERLDELVIERAEILDYADLEMNESYYYDNGHLNEKGTAELAKEIAKELR